MYKQTQVISWTAEEVDLEKDLKDWNEKLKDDKKYFISNVLAFFAASDGIVNENLVERFMQEVQIPEARCFYGFQIAIEYIHSEMYGQLIDTYIKDRKERNRLFNAIENFPAIKKTADWAFRLINSNNATYAKRIVAFALVEGIFFSGEKGAHARSVLQQRAHLQRQGPPQWLSCLMFKHLVNKPSYERMKIVWDVVEIECEFQTRGLASQFNRNELWVDGTVYQVRCWPSSPGNRLFYKTTFIENILLEGRINFFEKKVGEYQKAVSAMKGNSIEEASFITDADILEKSYDIIPDTWSHDSPQS